MSAQVAYAETPLWELDVLREHLYAELSPGRTESAYGAPTTPQPPGSDGPFATVPDGLKGLM